MNILLIEDDPILNETIADYLKMKGNEVIILEDGSKAIDIIERNDFDLYIVDINLPHISGVDIVKYIRENDVKTPIIMTTASMEMSHFKSAYQNGCDDYLKKPFYLEELEIRIDKLINKTIEANNIEQQNNELRKLANYDALTEIRNRRCLGECLEVEIERLKRYQHSFALIYIDVDNFKKINDNYGHQIGDAVLIDIAKVASKQLRTTDIFGRWGGEEFLIILPEIKLTDAVYTAERIRIAIEQYPFKNVDGVSLSLGVVESKVGETVDKLILRADELLYKAKNNGRNCVVSA